MENVKVYSFSATAEWLHGASQGGDVPRLTEPFRAMVNDMATRSRGQPLSLYVCSAEQQRNERNLFAFALARSVIERIPDTIVVDCDFLDVGLTGLVPFPDAIGFLDHILYGSSLTTITQRTKQGVTVIGAGSFAASKRTPFLMDAFDDAARYLRQASGCVIFCGPVLGDDGAVHPIAGRVDIPVFVTGQSSADSGALEPTEQKVAAAAGLAAWSVRIREPHAIPVTLTGPGADGVMDLSASVDEILDTATPAATVVPETPPPPTRESGEDDKLDDEVARVIDVPFEEEGPGEVLEERSWDSAFPKIVTTALAVFLIAFLLWWLYLTKSTREETGRPADIVESVDGWSGEAEVPGGEGPVGQEKVTGTDAKAGTTAVASGPQREASSESEGVVESQTAAPPATAEDAVEPARSALVTADLDDYAGKYFVHVSSFRGAARVQDDSDYLTERGHDIVITRVDLGNMGWWYRVYVGPFDTRNDAANTKIRLDENPRFRSTRITRVPPKSIPETES